MGSTNKTDNLKLSQFIDDDKPTFRGDYNSDMAKIEAGFDSVRADIAQTETTAGSALSIANDAKTRAEAAKATADSANSSATNANAGLDAVNTILDGLDARFSAINSAYTKTESDIRFVKSADANKHAIFIGSSNVTIEALWTADLCNEMGWIHHNYAVGGGGFTFGAPYAFSNQVARAIADNNYDHDKVGFVMVVDAGNDIRNMHTTVGYADPLWTQIRSEFPNAEIYCVPVLWGITADNLISERMLNLTKVVDELRDSCLANGVHFINNSWTWHYDKSSWMSAGTVHYTANGYALIKNMIKAYLRGDDTIRNMGRVLLPSAGAKIANLAVYGSRTDNIVTLNGTFKTNGASETYFESGVPLIAVPEGLRPREAIFASMLAYNQTIYNVQIQPYGDMLSWTSGQGFRHNETYAVNITYPIW